MAMFSPSKNLLLQFILSFFTNLDCQYLDVGSSIQATKDQTLPSSETIFLVYKQSTLSSFVNHKVGCEFEEKNPYVVCGFDEKESHKAICRCLHNAEVFDVGFEAEAFDVSDSSYFQYFVEEPGYYCAFTTPFENAKLKFNAVGYTIGSFVSSYSFYASLLMIVPIALAVVLGLDTGIIRWFIVIFLHSTFNNFDLRLTSYFNSHIIRLIIITIETYSSILLFRVIFNALKRKVHLKFHPNDNFNLKRQVFVLTFAVFQLILGFNKHYLPLNYYILGLGSADKYLTRYAIVIVFIALSLVYYAVQRLISKRVKPLTSDYKSGAYRLTLLIFMWSPIFYYFVALVLSYTPRYRSLTLIDTFKDDFITKLSIMFKDVFTSILMTVVVVLHWLAGFYY